MIPSGPPPSVEPSRVPDAPADRSRATALTLLLFAVGYNLAHHNGSIGSTGAPGGTRLADWIDLLTPFFVALPLLGFVSLQRPRRPLQFLAAAGAILYTQGQGIHLAANSVGNAERPDAGGTAAEVAHLWDEVVGHYLWYCGLAVLVAVCGLSVRGRPLGLRPWTLTLGGALCGAMWATNGLEGGTAVDDGDPPPELD